MATDATGTPSTLAIPKYNTSADAPSGKGLNAIVDAIDTLLAARITKATLTTTGDILYASGASTPARLAVGATGTVLTVAGGLPTWASSSSAYSLICDSVLGAPAANFDTNTILGGNIPATYKHLKLVVSECCSANSGLLLRFNNDSGSNYDLEYVSSLNNTATVAETFGTTSISFGTSSTGSYQGTLEATISDYLGAHYKSIIGSHHGVQTGPGNASTGTYGGSWRNTAAITRIQLVAGGFNFVVGSRFSLYGLS